MNIKDTSRSILALMLAINCSLSVAVASPSGGSLEEFQAIELEAMNTVEMQRGALELEDHSANLESPFPVETPSNGFYSMLRRSVQNINPKKIAYWTAGALVTTGAIVGIVVVSSIHKPAPVDPYSDIGRGMYISINSKKIGNWNLDDDHTNILGDARKEKRVLDFIKSYEIKTISFYDLSSIIPSPVLSGELSEFMTQARNAGVNEIFAIAASTRELNNVWSFHGNHSEKFDGIMTEVEFWNNEDLAARQADYANFLAFVKEIRTSVLNNKASGMIISSYLGGMNVPNITPAQIAEDLSRNLDRIYVSCYATSPLASFNSCKKRFELLGDVSQPIPVIPILSAEGKRFKATEDAFLGDWIAGNSVSDAEKVFRGEVEKSPATNKANILNSFYYYEFAFLSQYAPAIEKQSQ